MDMCFVGGLGMEKVKGGKRCAAWVCGSSGRVGSAMSRVAVNVGTATTTAGSGFVVRLGNAAGELEVDRVLATAYAQVFGDAAVLVRANVGAAEDADAAVSNAEEMLREGMISVRGFISMLCRSETFRRMVYLENSPHSFIDTMCRRLLGRAPLNQEEVARHLLILSEEGFEAEVDSYIESQEYIDAFGEDTVPFTKFPSYLDDDVESTWLAGASEFLSHIRTTSILQSSSSNSKCVTSLGSYTSNADVFEISFIDTDDNAHIDRDTIQPCSALSITCTPEKLNEKISLILRSGSRILAVSAL
eukprot:CAMPEP_0184677984 /NCGR_PEP_ID=MMETSP0312-20130426/625_1 /TAXON_ID=31354 /ORGANISM="Compsopogon coeruleus, Strain SAG 36.94" /LENGTH=302 /DNA_ID=CAMNT_0027126287 /DNA_START=69 /DNA_END=977 /DNA_ORIENTATION=-